LRSNNTKIVVNNANAKIDITSVIDVVSAMFKIINLKKTDNFIISTNSLVTVREVIRRLEKILNLKKRNIISLKKNISKNKTTLKGINKKISKECNWRPLYKLDDILASFAGV
jgi:nucleoside-diphosphate-sugar epimerase